MKTWNLTKINRFKKDWKFQGRIPRQSLPRWIKMFLVMMKSYSQANFMKIQRFSLKVSMQATPLKFLRQIVSSTSLITNSMMTAEQFSRLRISHQERKNSLIWFHLTVRLLAILVWNLAIDYSKNSAEKQVSTESWFDAKKYELGSIMKSLDQLNTDISAAKFSLDA